MAIVGTTVGIGQRHHEVTVQLFTDVVGDSGYPTETFADLATVFASREPVMVQSGAERLAADQVSARSFHRWTFPYDARVDPDVLPVAKMRLLYRGFPYDIIEAHVINLRAEIVITTMVKAA